MRKAFRAGITTSIIPTLPILMALIAIAPVLGLPVSWMRLSVIGSDPYELMAAGIGAKTMGVHSLGGEAFTSAVFANAIWEMSIGSFWAIMIVAVFYKGLKKRYALKASGDSRWQEVLTFTAMLGSGAMYMSYLTGNITNLKIPSAAMALEVCKVSPAGEEGEILSTIAIAGPLRCYRGFLCAERVESGGCTAAGSCDPQPGR
jgi:hypothetical protein